MTEAPHGATPPAGTPPAGATPPAPPAAPPAGTPPPAGSPPGSEPKIEEGYVKVPLKQWQATERDAGRYRSRKGSAPTVAEKRDQRYSEPPAGSDPDDPDHQKLVQDLQSTQKENMQLKLQNKVRDLLESDAYKDVPDSVKRILKRNPLSVVDNRARNLEDAVADIQDFLDDELEQSKPGTGTPAAVPGQPAATTPTSPETPPVNGSKPNPSAASGEESVEGKTGPARSVTILKNIFKAGGKKL